MLSVLPGFISMPLSFFLFCINLALCGSFIIVGGALKWLIPLNSWQNIMYHPMHFFYRLWASNNLLIINLFNKVEWVLETTDELHKDAWYLLIANHQSWLDILVLTTFARNRIAEPKFFLKDSLKKVPFVGMACWALNMPFMKRYNRDFIEKNPHLKGKDIETTKKSCQNFKEKPTSIINFVEGTRFTDEKHQQQNSPFHFLLTPKAGGIAFTLATLGEQFDKILNITILYPENNGHIMKDTLKGKLTRVVVHVEPIEVKPELIGDYLNDDSFKVQFQTWLNTLWIKKDELIFSFKNK
jgi:1-acyl-sn-glycerol-3-phosphate acyltransferase